VPIRPESPLTLRDALRPFAKRFAFAMLYFVVLFVGGFAGYVIIEGWGWFDSLYMTVTIATSLGIMEVHPLSTGGRMLTIVIVTLGVTGLGVWWGLIVALFGEMDPPVPDTHIEAEDVLIVVGEDDGILKLREKVRSAEVARRWRIP
jgi:hypothetical protein